MGRRLSEGGTHEEMLHPQDLKKGNGEVDGRSTTYLTARTGNAGVDKRSMTKTKDEGVDRRSTTKGLGRESRQTVNDKD